MKKQHVIFPALLLSLFSLAQEARISADFRGRDCSGGLGLCSVSGSGFANEATQVTVTKISAQSIGLIIDVKTASTEVQRNIAGKEFSKITSSEQLYFKQEKDIVLDSSILDKLGIDRKYHLIKEGSYPIVFDKEYAVVIFTLAEQ